MNTSDGLAAVSIPVSPWLLIVALLVVLFVGWKGVQLFLALFK